jgi:hypothetical protein
VSFKWEEIFALSDRPTFALSLTIASSSSRCARFALFAFAIGSTDS